MVYLGLNSNNGSSSASGSAGQNKNGSRTPELVDLDTEKPNERNGGKISGMALLLGGGFKFRFFRINTGGYCLTYSWTYLLHSCII